jgi:hypothetical protein
VIPVYIANQLGLGTGQILSVSKKFASLAPLLHSAMGFRLTITDIAIFTVCLILLAWSLMSERWIVVFGCLAAIALIQVLVVKNAYLPYVASVRTMKPFMARVSRRVDPNSPLLFYRAFDYGALFHSPVIYHRTRQDLQTYGVLIFGDVGRGRQAVVGS